MATEVPASVEAHQPMEESLHSSKADQDYSLPILQNHDVNVHRISKAC